MSPTRQTGSHTVDTTCSRAASNSFMQTVEMKSHLFLCSPHQAPTATYTLPCGAGKGTKGITAVQRYNTAYPCHPQTTMHTQAIPCLTNHFNEQKCGRNQESHELLSQHLGARMLSVLCVCLLPDHKSWTLNPILDPKLSPDK